MYDLKKLHNPDFDYNEIIPYRNPYFPSIYKGMTVEMHIVNHCNLNCAGCNHFSPLASPWFIDVKDFENQISALVNNISVIKELILLGGEPTLHPNLLELCSIARKYIPEERIVVLSNGVKLQEIKENIDAYKKLNIYFSFCSYPSYTDTKTINSLKQSYENISYFNTRHISHQTLIDPDGNQDSHNNFFHCSEHRLPCFTLRDYKLFICPFTAHRHLYECKKGINIDLIPGIDYLDINEIKGNLNVIQDFCFTEKNACRYCHQTNNHWIWHQSRQDIIEFEIPLKDLYFQDYKRYESIINDNFNYFIECCSENNPYQIDLNYGTDYTEKIIKRLGCGKIDIIIPHYKLNKELSQQLIQSLQEQTIIDDCVIYFISDNSPNERDLIEELYLTDLNYVLLKNLEQQGPGYSRNVGLEKSFNKYLFFLDADDYFCSSSALEDLYNKAEEGFDIVTFMMHANINIGNKLNYLINRNFLETKGISFNGLFFGEDLVFQGQLLSADGNIYNYENKENLFAVYNKCNNESLSNNLLLIDGHLNFIVSRLLASQYVVDEKFYANIIFTLNELIKIYRLLFLSDFYLILLYWTQYQIYKNNPLLYNKYNKNNSNLYDFNNNIFQITLSDRIIMSEQEGYNYLKKCLEELFLNNFYTLNAAMEIINYGKE